MKVLSLRVSVALAFSNCRLHVPTRIASQLRQPLKILALWFGNPEREGRDEGVFFSYSGDALNEGDLFSVAAAGPAYSSPSSRFQPGKLRGK